MSDKLENAMQKIAFADIPRIISAHYTVNVPLLGIPDGIANYQANYGLNLHPDFQRGHVWTKRQRSAFVEYVLRHGRFRTDIKFNMAGWPDNPSGSMVIVDGLQRLTALTMFLDDRVPVFGMTRKEWAEDDPNFEPMLRSLHFQTFSVNGLRTRAEVLRWYLELNAYGTPHTDSEIHRVRALLKEAEAQHASNK